MLQPTSSAVTLHTHFLRSGFMMLKPAISATDQEGLLGGYSIRNPPLTKWVLRTSSAELLFCRLEHH